MRVRDQKGALAFSRTESADLHTLLQECVPHNDIDEELKGPYRRLMAKLEKHLFPLPPPGGTVK